MLHNIARFYPSDYGDRFWTELPKFNDLLTSWGCWWEATVFLDAQQVMPNPSQQLEHWARYGSTWITTPAEIPNPFTELVNEYPKNGVDPSRFNSFPWLICSRGSGLGDAPPYRPGWQYFGWHGRRDYPKVTSSTEDMWYVSQGGAWSNEVATYPPMIAVHDEPIGFAEQAQDGRRSPPRWARPPRNSGKAGPSTRTTGSTRVSTRHARDPARWRSSRGCRRRRRGSWISWGWSSC